MLCLQCTSDKGALDAEKVRGVEKCITACPESHQRYNSSVGFAQLYLALASEKIKLSEIKIVPSTDECERLLPVAAISCRVR